MFGPGRDECRLKGLSEVSEEHIGRVLVRLVDVFLVAGPTSRGSESGCTSDD